MLFDGVLILKFKKINKNALALILKWYKLATLTSVNERTSIVNACQVMSSLQ